jgi:hypothetical protein
MGEYVFFEIIMAILTNNREYWGILGIFKVFVPLTL